MHTPTPEDLPKKVTKPKSGMDMRKQSVYLPGDMLAVLQGEAKRQGRSLSWVMQYAVRIALPTLKANADAPAEMA